MGFGVGVGLGSASGWAWLRRTGSRVGLGSRLAAALGWVRGAPARGAGLGLPIQPSGARGDRAPRRATPTRASVAAAALTDRLIVPNTLDCPRCARRSTRPGLARVPAEDTRRSKPRGRAQPPPAPSVGSARPGTGVGWRHTIDPASEPLARHDRRSPSRRRSDRAQPGASTGHEVDRPRPPRPTAPATGRPKAAARARRSTADRGPAARAVATATDRRARPTWRSTRAVPIRVDGDVVSITQGGATTVTAGSVRSARAGSSTPRRTTSAVRMGGVVAGPVPSACRSRWAGWALRWPARRT